MATVVLVSAASPADPVELVDSFDVVHADPVEIADRGSAHGVVAATDLSIIEGDRQQPQAEHADRKEQECSFDEHT